MLEGVTRRLFGQIGNGGGSAPSEPPRRPRIGFAVGGGVARGWAGIGVVRRLIAAGIEPDVVAGTSMGSVVGACLVGGHLDRLAAFAESLTPRRVLSLIDLHLGSAGLIGGDHLARLLAEHFGDTTIDRLPRPFTAVATELATGHEIWLNSGRVVDALRASYALPGVFSPVRISGRTLVDGALVDPVPVAVCRAQGAELVIAINLATDTFAHGTVVQTLPAHDPEPAAPPEGLGAGLLRRLFGAGDDRLGLTGVMMESFNIIQDRITRSRLAGDPPDVMIAPRLGHIGLFDFHRAGEAIAVGEAAADRALPEIAALIAELTR